MITLVMICILAGASAADNRLQLHSNAGKALAHRVARSLRKSSLKVLDEKTLQDDRFHDDADADDDDDVLESDADDSDKEDEEKDEEEADAELQSAEEAALDAARKKHRFAQADLEAFNDDKAFDKKISAEVKLITNETQSPSLSKFLGVLRTEMRMYNKPSYPKYLEGKVAAAEARVAELEKELGKEPEKKSVIVDAKKVGDENNKKDKKVAAEKATPKGPEPEKEKKQKAEAKPADVARDISQKASETWAISFFANIAMLAVVFAMASATNSKVRSYTWFLIDQVVAIFLAVMYFQAFDSLLDFGSLGTHSTLIASILHAVLMLAMVLALAYRFRSSEYDVVLAILCGAGAHVVAFSSIHAAAGAQNHWVGMYYHWSMCIFAMGVLGLGLGIIGYLVYTAKKKAQGNLLEDDVFMDKTDDLENDFGAMAFSVVFTLFVRFIITGHHPVDDETGFDHTKTQRLYMFVYACLSFVVAGFSVALLSKKAAEAAEANNYAKKRVCNFAITVSAMNVAWAFLYWGEWEFFDALFPGEAVKGRVMFAILSSIVGGLAIIGLTRLVKSEAKLSQGTKGAEMVAITAVGLIVAWSWELCFDAAVEDMTAGVSHPVGWKVASCLTLFSIILPVYAYYIKPACKRNVVEV